MNSADAPKSIGTSPLKCCRTTHSVHEHSEVLSQQTVWQPLHWRLNFLWILMLPLCWLYNAEFSHSHYQLNHHTNLLHYGCDLTFQNSLAGNYMHFNSGKKQGLTNMLLQWDLKSGLWKLSSPDDILSQAFSQEDLTSCVLLCKDTKRITEGCEIATNIGFQKLSQLKKGIQFICISSIGWG